MGKTPYKQLERFPNENYTESKRTDSIKEKI